MAPLAKAGPEALKFFKMPSIIRRNAVLISSLTGVVHLNDGDGMEGANHGKHLTF